MTMLFDRIEDARSLAQIVVETVREPLLVLDNTLTILVAVPVSAGYKTHR